MTTNVYVLKLESGKWYIGKSENPVKRYQEHVNREGSTWTRMYRPVCLEKVVKDVSPFEEDKVTKEYMAKYGIDNVRGGSYSNIELNVLQIEALKNEIRGAQDRCSRCGRDSHFVKDCYASRDINGVVIEDKDDVTWACEKCDREFEDKDDCIKHERYCKKNNFRCYDCGKLGHYSINCTVGRVTYYRPMFRKSRWEDSSDDE